MQVWVDSGGKKLVAETQKLHSIKKQTLIERRLLSLFRLRQAHQADLICIDEGRGFPRRSRFPQFDPAC